MAKEYSWADTRERAAKEFGGHYPDAALEQELIERFSERPAFVVDAIEDVIRGYQAGRIKSPWPFLRKKVAEEPKTLRVVDESEREKAILRAETWLRTAGLYCDREPEVEDILFGEQGILRNWSSDTALKARLLALWADLRPQGEQLERVAAERIAEQMKALRRADKLLAQRKPFAGFVTPGASEEDEWATT